MMLLMFGQDVRYAVRTLVRNPGFAVVAILTLSLGIGATTAIFSAVEAVLLRRLPFQEPEQLIRVYSDTPAKGVDPYFVNEGDLRDWRERNRSFEQIAAYWPTEFNVTRHGGRPQRIRGAAITRNFLSTIGVQPILGRGFSKQEDTPGGPSAALISYSLWQSLFAGDPAILEQSIDLQDVPYRVIGILPQGIQLIDGMELCISQPIRAGIRGPRYLDVIGRLRPGVRVEQARSDLQAISHELEAEFPETNKNWGAVLVPLRDTLFGNVRTPMLILLSAVALMLLIGCANIANLQLARAESRQREFAVRAALGASTRRIIEQLLIESLVISIFAGCAGLLLAYIGIAAVPRFGPQDVLRLNEISLNGVVLVFAVLTSLLTGILFGLAPLVKITNTQLDLHSSGTRSISSGRASRRVRNLLVISEVGLAVFLVNGAGLLLRSFSRLLDVNLGFHSESVITAEVGLPYKQYDKPYLVSDFYSRLIGKLDSEPGVIAAGATTSLPMRKDLDYRLNFSILGRPQPLNADEQSAFFRVVTAGYFRAMQIPLRSGRNFSTGDDAKAPAVVMINETMARRHWPNKSPIGDRLDVYVGAFGPLGYTLLGHPQIIGVVGDVRQTGPEAQSEPAIFFPDRQAPFRAMTVVVRTAANSAGFGDIIRRDVQSLDKALPVSNVTTLQQAVSAAVSQSRFRTMLLSLFAALALLLASIGIYGVIAYGVNQRRREIGIRDALGAQPWHIFQMLLGQVFGLVGAGVLIGTTAAIAGGRLLAGVLFGVRTPDPITLVLVPVLFTVVALGASIFPTARALSIDAAATLRDG